MSKFLVDMVNQVLGRAPEWVRLDLSSKEPLVRRRAEETLAAMITAALHEDAGDTLEIAAPIE